jgi:hypothetical protein
VDKCILLNLYELSESKMKDGSVSHSHPTLLVQNKEGNLGCEICKCKMSNAELSGDKVVFLSDCETLLSLVSTLAFDASDTFLTYIRDRLSRPPRR